MPQICDRRKHTICCPEKRPATTTTTFRPSNRISARSNLFNLETLIDFNYVFDYFQVCQEYAKHLIHSETFNNSLGNVITKTYSECGHTTHNLYTHNIVSTLFNDFDSFIILVSLFPGRCKGVSSHGIDWI